MSSRRKGVAILGSTGSIGRQTIEVLQAHPDVFEIVALVAGSDAKGLEAQASELGVARTGLGETAAIDTAALDEVDVVLNAIVGAAGLRASIAALSAGKTLALANKESLVAGGELCLAAARSGGGTLVPVDSEHSAIAQCLEGRQHSEVSRIVLTASGGPFRERQDLEGVTPEDALAHPTWNMGPKITIDSATLMNKGLEVIEAHFLFGFSYDEIDVVVHPQSVVHGIVELVDGSQVLSLGPADMRIPIQAALTAPQRSAPAFGALDIQDVGKLTFEDVDRERFPSLDLAYRAGREGQTYPAALNAANEVAVAAFLDREIRFTDIPSIVGSVLDTHEPTSADDLDEVLEADSQARDAARNAIVGLSARAAR